MSNSLIKFGGEFLRSLLYPVRCPICGKLPPSPLLICPICYRSITFIRQPFCYSCGKPLNDTRQEYCYDCTTHPKSFTRGFALAVYDSVTKPSLAAIKYKNKRSYLRFFAEETIRQYGRIFQKLSFDAILPVPLHEKRQKKSRRKEELKPDFRFSRSGGLYCIQLVLIPLERHSSWV